VATGALACRRRRGLEARGWHKIERELFCPARGNAWQTARIAGGFRRPRAKREFHHARPGAMGVLARRPAAGRKPAASWYKIACKLAGPARGVR